jgi:uncharacterized FAD-dependent dehydrogenase
MKVIRYRMSQIKLKIDESINVIPKRIVKKYGYEGMRVFDVTIVKESIDARKKNDIKKVYTIDFSTNMKLDLPEAPEKIYAEVPSGTEQLKHRPVIVGFGPCGMFCGLILAARGYRPIIVERGYAMEDRIREVQEFWRRGILNPECNVQFGEGGAGTFSDGKLTTGIKDPRVQKVLEEFVMAGADPDIMYKQKPHIGTDVLRHVVMNIRYKIERLGGEIKFDARMNHLNVADGAVSGIMIQKGYQLISMDTDNVVLAIGHSSRDTLRSLVETGVDMEQKPFSIGVRVEHPQEMVDKAQYGASAGNEYLPHAIYKLAHHCRDGRGVYTFCMCPGGEVIVASSETGCVVTNGMSYHSRNSGTANSGLLVDVRTSDFGSDSPLAGVEFQEKYERIAFANGGGNYHAPKTTWGEFRDDKDSAKPVIECLPEFAVSAIREAMPELGKKMKGFDDDEAVFTAVETRSSSPVRICRGKDHMGSFKGLYPAGEGAGYAGGIVSSACDGIRVAEEIIRRYAPLDDK